MTIRWFLHVILSVSEESRGCAKPSMKMGGQEVAFSSIRELAGSHQLQFVINTYLA